MLPVVKNNKSAVPASAFGRALARVRGEAEPVRGPRLGFVVDATASREAAWLEAQTIQRRMFSSVAGLGGLRLRLVHFGGGEVTDRGWMADPREVAAAMADVQCRTSITRILPALRAFLDDPPDQRADAVILVGDSFEEEPAAVEMLAGELRRANIRVFTFLEGDDADAAQVFRRLAAATGGQFARFGAALPLGDLCAGVALLAAGGRKAVKRLRNENVRRLLLAPPEHFSK